MTVPELIKPVIERAPGGLVDVRNVVVEYQSKGRRLRALDGVSLAIHDGEAVGLIGESGSGKSTLLRAIAGLIEPVMGTVLYQGEDVYKLRSTDRFRKLGRRAALVFQDPRSSLNPRLTVGAVVEDPLTVHAIGKRNERKDKVAQLLASVGLSPVLASRPVRALSGGQLQRVAVARALAVEPSLIVLDEPTSALDVSVQAQILNLLRHLRRERGVAMIVVSHDIRVIRYLTDRTAVMYHGEIVESGQTDRVCEGPTHEYTKKLLSAVPTLNQYVQPT
ncbi:hypothetical protein BAY59_22750 [Prauserella coralliicola]|nr:hypothetical protein BAY59_22750 [Prauserella coralliicola]